ncbi:hypothetical protein FB563_3162 [Streptomyces puniciscabiei]|uniref:Uncharacterized protein n=1 Tax=Streptomyces puniciscabiei TaxID=164348 RepID=A0A542UGE6_9ACTN|nr:hypothetical protein [Streptomyces puniciscabiei]TQK98148.1 hypothetical protein FB563_3162 [Streptomyces puniciscabiei]
MTVTPKKGIADSDELPGDNATESYSVLLTGIPKNGTQATAKVVCLDSDNEQHTYAKTFQVAKPAAGGAEVKNFG